MTLHFICKRGLGSISEVDQNVEFIFTGVRDGFKIVDDVLIPNYKSCNYKSMLLPTAALQMDDIVTRVLHEDKLLPHCIHALGVVSKQDDSLRPIVDGCTPVGSSINEFMDTVCTPFNYISMDDGTSYLTEGSYMGVVDIKTAYRSVHILPDHRRYQELSSTAQHPETGPWQRGGGAGGGGGWDSLRENTLGAIGSFP